jgi:hypothetical protein
MKVRLDYCNLQKFILTRELTFRQIDPNLLYMFVTKCSAASLKTSLFSSKTGIEC